MTATQLDLFLKPEDKKEKYPFFAFSQGTLRFALHFHQATNRHFDLRLQLNASKAISIPFYEDQFLQSWQRTTGTRVKDHGTHIFHVEGPGAIHEAIVMSDIGFIVVNNRERNRGANDLFMAMRKETSVLISFYGNKIQGNFSLIYQHKNRYGQERWQLERKAGASVSKHNLQTSIITGCTVEDYICGNAPILPEKEIKSHIQILTDQLLHRIPYRQ